MSMPRSLAVGVLECVLVLAGLAGAAETPAAWLPTEGKSEDWLKATAKCRELLGKLKLDDPLVQKHLPNVKDKADLLRPTTRQLAVPEAFDWKKVTAVEFLENMLADLAAGVAPGKRHAGKELALPYWSQKMDRVEAIWLHVPPAYDPAAEAAEARLPRQTGKRPAPFTSSDGGGSPAAKSYQLFVCYKCGGGIYYKDGKATGGYRPTLEMANQTDTFFAWSSLYYGVKGRMGVDYELMEAVPAIAREFSVDPDRVFLTGYSDGGFTSLWLASRYPHLVAGIAPECANWQYSNVNQVGLLNVPLLVVDGWSDGGYIERNFSRWHTLHTMGSDTTCIIGHHGHTYAPYEDADELKQILDWAKTKRRNLWPRRVRYATWNLSWHQAFWLSIERMADPSLAAQIDAEVKDGNRIEVQAWNVAAYKLALSDKLADPAKPLAIVTNGKESYAGPFKSEVAVELVKAAGKFAKSPAMPGDITAQITRSTYGSKEYLKVADRPWLWVKPSGGDPSTSLRAGPKLLGKWTPDWAKADAEVTDADLALQSLPLRRPRHQPSHGPHRRRPAGRPRSGEGQPDASAA